MRIGVVHGPNLGTLGLREPAVYGSVTLDEVDRRLGDLAGDLAVDLVPLRSNHEGEIVDFLEAEAAGARGFLVNPGGLTHTSVVLRDALLATGRPFVEVHVSNPHARESFRHRSLLSDISAGVVYGFGWRSYLVGLRGLVDQLRSSDGSPSGPTELGV